MAGWRGVAGGAAPGGRDLALALVQPAVYGADAGRRPICRRPGDLEKPASPLANSIRSGGLKGLSRAVFRLEPAPHFRQSRQMDAAGGPAGGLWRGLAGVAGGPPAAEGSRDSCDGKSDAGPQRRPLRRAVGGRVSAAVSGRVVEKAPAISIKTLKKTFPKERLFCANTAATGIPWNKIIAAEFKFAPLGAVNGT